jgi:predicted transposase YdaD
MDAINELEFRFANLLREEISAMLGTNVENIRAFREAKEEGARERLPLIF